MILLFFLISLLTVPTVHAGPWYQESINVESKVGTDRSIQSLDVMYPLSHSKSSLTFTDLRGRIDDDQSVEVNLGLAHRHTMSNFLSPMGGQEAVLGYYGFADRLESKFNNTFYQATAGFEYFTKNYSFRVNGYLPEDERKPTTTFTELEATGTQIFFEDRVNYERPLPGFDVELGRTVRFDGWQLYGRGSYFRFHHSDVAEIEGERFRAGIQLPGSTFASDWSDATQLTLGVEWQRDDVRDEQSFGVFRVSVPFGSSVGVRGSGVKSQTTNEDRKSKIENSSPSSTSRSSATSDLSSPEDGGEASKLSRSALLENAPTRGEERNSFSPSTGEKRKEGESSSRGSKDIRLSTLDVGLKSWQKDRLTERIERDVDIVTAGSERSEVSDTQPAVLATTGETLTDVAVAEGGASGAGTFNNPGTLSSAINTAGDSGTVFVVGELRSDGVTLRNSQAVIGGNLPVIESADGSETTALTATSKDPHIEGTTSDPTIRLDTGTSGYHLRGFSVSGKKEALRVEDDVGSARLSDLAIESGDLVIRDDAGRGTGDQFILERIDVESGGLTVGKSAGSENGTFSMTQVDVSDSLSVGKDAGFFGSFSMTNLTLHSGDLTIGDGAGSVDGEFTMDTVAVNKGFLDIGERAGGPTPSGTLTGGDFEMNHVNVGDSLSVGKDAGYDSGSFSMSDVGVVSGDLRIDTRPGASNGAFRMQNVVLDTGDLTIDKYAALDDGKFTMTDVTLDAGDLSMGNGAGSRDGEFTMDTVTINNGYIDIGDFAGRDQGSFSMNGIEAGDTLSVGDQAATLSGSLSMKGVVVGDRLSVGSQAGEDGSFSMTDVDVDSGNLSIGNSAGASGGDFTVREVDVHSDGITIGDDAGNNGSFSADTVTTEESITIGQNAGAHGGSFSLWNVRARSGDLVIKKQAGGEEGDFAMEKVRVRNGFLDIGDNAASNIPGSPSFGHRFSMKNVTVGDTVSIGRNAGLYRGSFQVQDLRNGGDFTVGNSAGFNGGLFSITASKIGGRLEVGDDFGSGNGGLGSISGTTIGNGLHVGEGAGSGAGSGTSVSITQNTLTNGDLCVGDNAVDPDGSLRIQHNTLESGGVEVGSSGGGDLIRFDNDESGTPTCP